MFGRGFDVCNAFPRKCLGACLENGFGNELGRVNRIWSEGDELVLFDTFVQPGKFENNNVVREIGPIAARLFTGVVVVEIHRVGCSQTSLRLMDRTDPSPLPLMLIAAPRPRLTDSHPSWQGGVLSPDISCSKVKSGAFLLADFPQEEACILGIIGQVPSQLKHEILGFAQLLCLKMRGEDEDWWRSFEAEAM